MTILVAFKCKNGIVLVADSMISTGIGNEYISQQTVKKVATLSEGVPRHKSSRLETKVMVAPQLGSYLHSWSMVSMEINRNHCWLN